VRLRSGGERLQLDARRPRRTLKNLFQEAGIPPWERGRLPLLFSGDELVWVPGIGIDARFQAPVGANGLVPEWKKRRGVAKNA
jgi:tRNA(Ile)-lysidine synthase